MQAAQSQGSPAAGPRTRPTPIHAMQSSPLARLNNSNARLQALPCLPHASPSSHQATKVVVNFSAPHFTTVFGPSATSSFADTQNRSHSTPAAERSEHQLFSNRGAAGSSLSSSPSAKPALENKGFNSIFDEYVYQESQILGRREEQISGSDSLPLEFNFHGNSDDDDEDLKDLSAINYTKSIRMNLEALTRSSADHYAHNADGYADPNVHYGAKALEDSHESDWMQNSYAQLLTQLSIAQVGAEDERCLGHHIRSYEPSQDYDTPKTSSSSSKDSPPATSLDSNRSSSDAHEYELRTPPEPNFEGFAPTIGSAQLTPANRQIVQSSSSSNLQAPSSSFTPPSNQASSAPQLGSPFQPSQPRPNQSLRSDPRSDQPHEVFGLYEIGNSSELEFLSDDVNAQRRAAGKGRMMPWHSDSSSSQSQVRRRSSNLAFVDTNRPYTRLGPQAIAFSATTIPELRLTPSDCVDIIVPRYPSLCDAPLREFGEDGQPLPPTKKQETSDAERQARREALRVNFCAKQRLSLIKAMVVMESRSASWKRVGPLNPKNNNVDIAKADQPQQGGSPRSSGQIPRLPPMPSPWSMEIRHEQLDIAQIKGKSKKTFELASLRTNARCSKCDGSGLGACVTCKAEKADECFWCSGTGREKCRAQAWCRRCQGAGVLKCNTCHGSLKSDCRSCEGTGIGEYGFFVDVTVKRVEMPAVPVSTLLPHLNSAVEPNYDEVKTAATLALWDSVTKLMEARSQVVAAKGGRGKAKEMIPVMAACVWENSILHVVAVDVPLAAKFKKGSVPALRPEGLHRRIPTKRRFFTVPNDADLRSVELTEDEVRQLASPHVVHHHTYQRDSPAPSAAQSQASLGTPYQSPSVNSSTFEFSLSPPLATPEEGGSVCGYSTPSRVPSPRTEARPGAKEFVHRPSPLSQLGAVTPSPSILGESRQSYIEGQPYQVASYQHEDEQTTSGSKLRRPSAGHVLTKKLSSNILGKFGAKRGSV
ncbi:related to conserved hypothetical Ustilaginaceae-specific protein [Melanopsichium pennsylvanicum]|uniref:Related to conserved hypothetical Ustilaginaceae-specific protein n=2 Tax=Melanopsichium pennsylvanicum TaxID=63383 RepID=A0AAJ4XMX3_9BASI|nr:conserved hypothetical Ustilago-specific protein [Melanopsichium pennsylvanicum 4]SNX83948.1 related to conserved hypothetical Ustilaginaceae-specific protein [Melanopsichium pennsylvanicum]